MKTYKLRTVLRFQARDKAQALELARNSMRKAFGQWSLPSAILCLDTLELVRNTKREDATP